MPQNLHKQSVMTTKAKKKKRVMKNILEWQIDEDFNLMPLKCNKPKESGNNNAM